MTTFQDPKITFNDQANGRVVSVNFNKNVGFPNVSATFLDDERPDETNAEERARVLLIAKTFFEQAATSL
ncbi:hypothetical protein [Rhizobium sp. Root483D2]|uniref:hypothetical protein n=1 Tax=Rhizobium sp. Root483D2 TaxID=1736545 RepID=UPI0007154B47|nr:hypothetical protein [Rhizobium sp. Root483D2]KQY20788.1 hypothetical protein ASD32_05070 [Rhizobium sp. Root483D2]